MRVHSRPPQRIQPGGRRELRRTPRLRIFLWEAGFCAHSRDFHQKRPCFVFRKGRDSCLVSREKLLAGLGVVLPAGGPVGLAFVCATDEASRDMRNSSSLLMLCRSGRKKKTEGLQYQHDVIRNSCFVKNRLAGLGVDVVGAAVRAVDAGRRPEGIRAPRRLASARSFTAPCFDPGSANSLPGRSATEA